MPDAVTDLLPRDPGGRVPGRRGAATRERLLAALAELLATESFRGITVTEVARVAQTSPATYYQYFLDVESAVLALAEVVAEDAARLSAPLRGRKWRGLEGWQSALAVVDAFLEFWRDHQPVLRATDLLAGEGDERARAVRVRLLDGAIRELTAVIRDARSAADPRAAADPAATAAVLVSMLSRVAGEPGRYDDWRVSAATVRDAMADLVYWGVTGPRAPEHPRPRPNPVRRATRGR